MKEYTPPTLTTVSARELLELLGPAQGLSSGATGDASGPEKMVPQSGRGQFRR